MVVLRFKDRSPREFKVPLNIRIRGVEVPIGLMLIFLILLFTAVLNLLTKEVATIGGLIFTAVFLAIFIVSERYHEKRRGGGGAQAPRAVQPADRPTRSRPAVLRLDASRTASWWRSARRRTCSCWKRRWPKPIPRRPTWW